MSKLKEEVGKFESKLIKEQIKQSGGITQAARALGVSRATIYNKCNQYGISTK